MALELGIPPFRKGKLQSGEVVRDLPPLASTSEGDIRSVPEMYRGLAIILLLHLSSLQPLAGAFSRCTTSTFLSAPLERFAQRTPRFEMSAQGDRVVESSSALDGLRNAVAALSASDAADARAELVSAEQSRSSRWHDAVEINSLVFRPKPSDPGDAVYAVAILPSSENVDVRKLSAHLANGTARERWELAPAHRVEGLCGFPPGSVPPLGYEDAPSRVVVDAGLAGLGRGRLLLGGGGNPDRRCLLSVGALLEANCETAGIAVVDVDERFDGGMQATRGARRPPKPFFSVAPPGANSMVSEEAPHRAMPVTAIGRLTSVRQIAKKLVFADFAPPDYPLDETSASERQAKYEKDMPWRSGEDGQDMYVQMIVGKTVCDALGEVEGPAALKTLKPGRLVLMRGAANVDPRQKNGWTNSAGNWVRSLLLFPFGYPFLYFGLMS